MNRIENSNAFALNSLLIYAKCKPLVFKMSIIAIVLVSLYHVKYIYYIMIARSNSS